jgi:hypothetical protein
MMFVLSTANNRKSEMNILEGREILIAVVSVSDFCFNSVFGFQFGFHLNHKNRIQ